MFCCCLFECRPKATKPAGLGGFLELAQGRGVRELAFPLVGLSRQCLSQLSLLYTVKEISRKEVRIFLMLKVFKCRTKTESAGPQDISSV